MAKLKKLLEDVFQEEPQTNKYEVIEGVRNFGIVGKQLYNNGNIMEIAKQLSEIAEHAHSHVLSETDEWFDKHVEVMGSDNKTNESMRKELKKRFIEDNEKRKKEGKNKK